MKQRKHPIPTAVAYMSDLGMSSTMRPRTPVTERKTKMRPSTKAAARAALYVSYGCEVCERSVVAEVDP